MIERAARNIANHFIGQTTEQQLERTIAPLPQQTIENNSQAIGQPAQ